MKISAFTVHCRFLVILRSWWRNSNNIKSKLVKICFYYCMSTLLRKLVLSVHEAPQISPYKMYYPPLWPHNKYLHAQGPTFIYKTILCSSNFSTVRHCSNSTIDASLRYCVCTCIGCSAWYSIVHLHLKMENVSLQRTTSGFNHESFTEKMSKPMHDLKLILSELIV